MKRIILGALLLLLPASASASETLSVDQLFAEYEAEVAVSLPSHWECLCDCVLTVGTTEHQLDNPDDPGGWFRPGGTEDECPKMNGKQCIGELAQEGGEVRGELIRCEWTLVPDAK